MIADSMHTERLDDDQMEKYMIEAHRRDDLSTKYSNLVIVELLNRLLEK